MDYSIFKSRLVWTGIIGYMITYGPIVSQIVPEQWKPIIDALIGLLMFYFHVNPSQPYNVGSIKRNGRLR